MKTQEVLICSQCRQHCTTTIRRTKGSFYRRSTCCEASFIWHPNHPQFRVEVMDGLVTPLSESDLRSD